MSFLIHKGDCIAVINSRFKTGTAVSFCYTDSQEQHDATVSDGRKWVGMPSKHKPHAEFLGERGVNKYYRVASL